MFDYVAVLPLLGGVVAPGIGFLVYSHTRLRLKLKDSIKSRAYLFYRVLSGVLLGQFLRHLSLQPNVSFGIGYTLLFVKAGYLLMDVGEGIGRVWNSNGSYTGPLDDHVNDEVALNREKMVENTVLVSENISSNEFANGHWIAEDLAKDKRKRRWMLGVLFVVFTIVAVMDGMMLVLRDPNTTTSMVLMVIFYYVNGISMSVAVYSAMIHAKIMHIEEDRPRLLCSLLLGLTWSVILVCSSIPALVGMQSSTVPLILGHPAFTAFIAFYGLASGCVLRLQQYFYRKLEDVDKRETAVGILVFIFATAVVSVTGLWL